MGIYLYALTLLTFYGQYILTQLLVFVIEAVIMPLDVFTASVLVLSGCIAYSVYTVTYALFFDAHRHIPGPFLARFTRLWELYHTAQRNDHQLNIDLHRKYGPVVRLAPNRFSFNQRADLNTIYNRHPTKAEYYDAFGDPQNPNLLSIKEFKPYVHRLRAFAGLYSTTSAIEYEPLVDQHIQRLKDALALESQKHTQVDLPKLLKLFVFDTISQMTVRLYSLTPPLYLHRLTSAARPRLLFA